MKVHARLAAVLIAVASFTAALAAAPCDDTAKVIDELRKGVLLQALSVVAQCESGIEGELGAAFLAFREKKPAEAPAVAASIRDAYKAADRLEAYGAFAAAGLEPLVAPPPPSVAERNAQTVARLLEEMRATHRSLSNRVLQFEMFHPWLIAVLVAAAISSLVAATGVGLSIVARWRRFETLRTIATQVTALTGDVVSLQNELRTQSASLGEERQQLDAKLSDWIAGLPEHLRAASGPDVMCRRLDELQSEIAALHGSGAGSSAGDPLSLEHEALREAWLIFEKSDSFALFDGFARDGEWVHLRDPLLVQLPKLVPDDLKPSLDAALAPALEFDNTVRKLKLARGVQAGKVTRLGTDGQELMRTRELAQMLISPGHLSDRLAFRPEQWIADTFVGFADLYLQRYQEALMEGRHAPLDEGLRIVRSALRSAGIEPVELTLGQTLFDSAQHVGRSATTDTRFPDGVIVAVVRNGFIHGGRDVIRQPEVIVNRTR